MTLLEGVVRFVSVLQHLSTPSQSTEDAELGWKAVPGLDIEYDVPGYGAVRYSTDEFGFRRSGEVDTDKVRVLALGDSSTQAVQVSDGETWFDYLADHDDRLEVFAYGAGGFGTLQERLILDRHVGRIDPQIVVWQFCSNDLINSDVRLEAESSENSNHMMRPYFEGGRIVYRHPDGWLGRLANLSLLFRRLAVIRGSLLKRTIGSVEHSLTPEHPGLQRSLATMRSIVSGAIEAEPERTFVAFNVFDHDPRPYEIYVFGEICKIRSLHCVTGIREALRAAEDAGETINGGFDTHWNARGHEIAGAAILDYLMVSGSIDGAMRRASRRTQNKPQAAAIPPRLIIPGAASAECSAGANPPSAASPDGVSREVQADGRRCVRPRGC